MRVKVKQVEGLWRLIDTETGRVAVNAHGTPLDGGGHSDEAKANRQAGYINRK